VPFTTAVLGGKVKIPGVEKELTITVPPRTSDSSILRLKNQGFYKANSPERGNLLVKIKINVPKKLSRKQKELLDQLKETGI
jgi:DnaJ-class molecular chaperone